MSTIVIKARMALKAFWQLGWKASFLYGWYQIILRSGVLKIAGKAYPSGDYSSLKVTLPPSDDLLNVQGNEKSHILTQANEVLDGNVRLFGGEPRPLKLTPPGQLAHWTRHTADWVSGQDIKFTWEPGRFGWATLLARAYYVSADEKYTSAFWNLFEEFNQTNPPQIGQHWSSAQEVALRIIAWVFSYTIFENSVHTTPERSQEFTKVIAAHAERIPPTLMSARAQNNNHLLTEAAGLYTASAVLPDHPRSPRWRKLGWKGFNSGIQSQISADGSYIQNSANYHRLMLQTGLWFVLVAKSQGQPLPDLTLDKLGAATQWLETLLDQDSGQAPNLGPNDGGYILPLSALPFNDYRPVLQAAGLAFLGQKVLPNGPWDEMSLWLSPQPGSTPRHKPTPKILRMDSQNSWGVLRAATFKDRPGHADQLHFDLWWRGLNISLDPGTYLYNAPPPWANSLGGTDVHNTVMVNHQHQMTRAGKFLWLDWAQAKTLENSPKRVAARHNGYRKLGVTHKREVEITGPDQWQITDSIFTARRSQYTFRLHWLLPDWPWELERGSIHLDSPYGRVKVELNSAHEMQVNLARGGELLFGEGSVEPHRGWYSPTYGVIETTLSLAVVVETESPIQLTSTFEFPE